MSKSIRKLLFSLIILFAGFYASIIETSSNVQDVMQKEQLIQ